MWFALLTLRRNLLPAFLCSWMMANTVGFSENLIPLHLEKRCYVQHNCMITKRQSVYHSFRHVLDYRSGVVI